MGQLIFLATEHSSQQGFNIANIIVNVIAGLILFWALYKFAWSKLLNMLDERQALVNNQLDEAERNQKESLELLKKNQENLANAQAEIKDMMEKAREQSKLEKRTILNDAKEHAELIKENARRDIEDEKNKALDEISKQIVELSVLVASKIIEKELDANAQSVLVDKIIREVGNK
ncbi:MULTISPECIES: F0F1 ATP synthase subunit B [unclassified Gemella]|uniref:F0F1 ATP synthase subunit B n=1 Tax=unclassified Gemella TaxID=2624949 RepID=UPI001C0434E8|nr:MULTISPECIES: F0F1 ATP synthase subunit B [unclassified Gemella]MBU0278423.1 F0F1 ATP synthase subunit B [Gemella sp. zg-1178]QWQ38965.1 F0F1 ATP synthase subunit B [Gemella sp. zg-570]